MSLDSTAIRPMAERYTEAWCSRSAEAVASFFEENGKSVINSGPDGTGNSVRIVGWQNWPLSDNLLLVEADGGFDATEYERKIREGI